MPLRDFECECSHKFEKLVYASEEKDLQECPKCGKMGNSRLVTMAGAYKITGNNSASTKPNGGAFRKGKSG